MIDIDALEALAKAATPGPWQWMHREGWHNAKVVRETENVNSGPIAKIPANARSDRLHAENVEFIAAASPTTILALIADVRRLSGIVEKYIDPSQVMMTGMNIGNGSFDIGLEGGPCRLFAGAFAEQFRKSGGTNYVEMRFDTGDAQIGELLVTLQRSQGKTPAECRRDAEAERDELKEEMRALRAECHSLTTACGEMNEEVVRLSNIKDTLLSACVDAVLALAHASQNDPLCQPAYDKVSAAIDAARKDKS